MCARHLQWGIIVDFNTFTKTRIVRFEDLLALIVRLVEVDNLISLSFFDLLLLVFLVNTVASDQSNNEDERKHNSENDSKDSFVFSKSILIILGRIDIGSTVLFALELLLSDYLTGLGIFGDLDFILDIAHSGVIAKLSFSSLKFFSKFLEFIIGKERILRSDGLIIVNDQSNVSFRSALQISK